MSQYITTFSPTTGASIFSSKLPDPLHAHPIPLGKITYLYTTHTPPNLSTEADIDTYLTDRENGLPPTSPVPPGGTNASLIELAPGAATPVRRTITVGVFRVLKGIVRLMLDSGEERVLKEGDVVVIRGAKHTWRNETEGEGEQGWAKLMVFAMSVKDFEVNGKQVEAEWL
ncbi:hypothetical protein M409DRAFT_27464 [Zasmidium cellare ATCC 36951]|uniref:Cupin type-2 domain-containing protein n=1 Tax=Zasmidium cellare ATCC 36951 TaxID=1080233 RepID=A0A6A6C4J7_ZASCE|nr:uncharacterized protein M409DRAFT_27464 [Zasmidium cellare ATCC 36951]KAF2162087.1 hypothetical protein M409DRAFT_27464 [Zasmidium cellare ATCC 36951]